MSEAWGQASRLLEGPRGCQLCLELALEVERSTWPADSSETVGPLANAVFFAGVGQPGVLFYRSAEPGYGGLDAESVAIEVEDLAEALAGIPVETCDPQALPEGLGNVVDSARYWQKPDRIEALSAPPRVVILLDTMGASAGRAGGTRLVGRGRGAAGSVRRVGSERRPYT